MAGAKKEPEAAENSSSDQRPAYNISRFLFSRTLAFTYCAAFLSLAAQADGLFGCQGAFPPSPEHALSKISAPLGVPPVSILQILALAGAILAGAGIVAVGPCEKHASATFAVLWFLFAACTKLAPFLYPALEDRVLLEVGLVGVFIVSGPGTVHEMGRSLAVWCLFRAIFAAGVQKVAGPCGAWRSHEALHDAYQLEPFPLPGCWILWLAPDFWVQALTCFQLYVELAISLLLLVPARQVVAPAAMTQLAMIILQITMMANRGCAEIGLIALTLSIFDDSWHRCLWSEHVLKSWGCKADEVCLQEGGAAKANDEGEKGGSTMTWVVAILMVFGGYLVSLACVSQGFFPWEQVGSVLQRFPGACMCILAVAAACCWLPAALRAMSRAASSKAVALALVASALWLAGLMQLAQDVHSASGNRLSGALGAAAGALEAVDAAHTLAAGIKPGGEKPCPQVDGRQGLLLQGAVPKSEPGAPVGQGTAVSWIDLSSRLLPSTDDRRPVWTQPYTARLDQELWRLSQKKSDEKKLPKWTTRLLHQLWQREGMAARLSAGHWQGAAGLIHGGAESPYAKATKPLLAMRALLKHHTPVQDVHSNKWWNTTSTRLVRQMIPEELQQFGEKQSKKGLSCVQTPAILEDLPIVEALASLILASLLWKLLVNPAVQVKKKAVSRGRKRQ